MLDENGRGFGIRGFPRHHFHHFVWARFPGRSKTCQACGDKPTIKTMGDSAAFAAKHGLTVERPVPETEDVPTATCQVIARAGLSWVGWDWVGFGWVDVEQHMDGFVSGVLGGWVQY